MLGIVGNTVCGATIGGIGSGIFASFMNVTGIAKQVANTTAPLFQDAVCYGLINGAIHGILTNSSNKAKEVLKVEERDVLLVWNISILALCVIARYSVARYCNESFQANISRNYVHIGSVLHAFISPWNLMIQSKLVDVLTSCIYILEDD